MTIFQKILRQAGVLLALIVVLGAFLRFYHLGALSFVADEFLDINASYGYFATGEWQAWDFNREEPAVRENVASDERAWLYRLQVATLFQFLPPTEAVARSISALWGVLTIVLLYFVAVSFTKNRTIGLLAAFLFAVSVVGIEFDRTIRMYAMFFPWFLLFSWMFFKMLESPYRGQARILQEIQKLFGINALYAFPVLLTGLVSMHLHQLTGNVVLIVAAYLFVMVIITWRSERTLKNRYGAYCIVLCAVIVAVGILAPALFTQFSNGLIFFDFHPSYISKIFTDYAHPLLAFFILVLGALHLVRDGQRRKEGVWLVVSALMLLIAAVFLWRRNVGAQYIFFAQSFVIILLATGVYALADFLRGAVATYRDKIFITVIVLGIVLVPRYGYFFEENNAYHQTSAASNPNYRKVFDYVKKNRMSDDVLITRNFRNYYFSGEKMTVYDFGGERTKSKITLEKLEEIIARHPHGWLIYADSDETFVSKEARAYAEEECERVSAPGIRGPISIYRW